MYFNFKLKNNKYLICKRFCLWSNQNKYALKEVGELADLDAKLSTTKSCLSSSFSAKR